MPLTGPPDPVLVIGPGAIGGITAARLAQKGLDVTVACRTAATAGALGERGITAIDPGGRTVVGRVKAVVAPEELTTEPVVAFHATKCADAAAALRHWAPQLPAATPIVAMQNGLMGDELAAHAGGRLVECVVGFAATLQAPGRCVQTGPGGFVVGEWPGAPASDRVLDVVRRLEYVNPVRTSANMRGAKWTKLLINSAITTLGVVANTTLGELLRHPRARDLFLDIVTEGHRAGKADGVRFEPVQGFRPGLFALPQGASRFARSRRYLLLRVVARKHGRHKSSSLQSLERGRATEVDYLNGVIVAAGARHGVPTPVNAALVGIVHEIEAGKRAPGMANLDEIRVVA